MTTPGKTSFLKKRQIPPTRPTIKKENLRKIEERTMHASTPHTAKKQAASTNTAEDLSKTIEIQLHEAKQTMAKIKESMTSQKQPQYIQEMQQQLLSLQDNVQKLEKNTENPRRDLSRRRHPHPDVHDTLYTQQQRDAARQTVEKGWPKDFSDEERDAAIKWHMEEANVDNYHKLPS